MHSELTDEDLSAIEARCNDATPGPWTSMIEGRDHISGDSFIMVGSGSARKEDMYITVGGNPASVADQDFIAAARQDVPRLLAELRRLRAH